MKNSITLNYFLTLLLTLSVVATSAFGFFQLGETTAQAQSVGRGIPRVTLTPSTEHSNRLSVAWTEVSGATEYQYATQRRKAGTTDEWVYTVSKWRNVPSSLNAKRKGSFHLLPGHEYRFWFKAKGGDSPAVRQAATTFNLAKVSGLQTSIPEVTNNEGGPVTLSWTPLLPAKDSANYDYDVAYEIRHRNATDPNDNWIQPTTKTRASSHDFTGIASANFIFQVRAYLIQRPKPDGRQWVRRPGSEFGPWSDRLTYQGKSGGTQVTQPATTTTRPTTQVTSTLDAITNLRSTSTTQNSITLKWDSVNGATRYLIFISRVANGQYQSLDNINVPEKREYVFGNLDSDTQYYFVVIPYDPSTTPTRSGPGANIHVSTRGEVITSSPSKVTGLTATRRASSQITDLRWNAIEGADVTEYEYSYQRVDGDSTYDWVSDSIRGNTLSLTRVTVNAVYVFRVRAKNSIGTGDWSDVVADQANTIVTAPGGLRAVIDSESTSTTVSWNTVSGSNIHYDLIYRDAGVVDSAYQIIRTTQNRQDLNIPYSKTYEFRVRARQGGSGYGVWSAPITKNNPYAGGPEIPNQVQGVQVNVQSATEIIVEWNAISGVSRYVISINGDETRVDATSGTRYTLRNLQPETRYQIRVRAVSPDSSTTFGNWSATRTVRTPTATTTTVSVAQVGGVSASVLTNGTIRVTWNPVPDATAYQVEYYPTDSSTKQTTSPSSNSVTLTDVSASTRYAIRVRAYRNTSAGNWSGLVYATTPSRVDGQTGTAGSITGLTVTSTSSTEIGVSWASQSNVSYDVWYCVAGTNNQCISNNWLKSTASTNRITLRDLQSNTTYYIAVRAVGTNTGNWSNTVPATTRIDSSQTAPGQVQGLDYRVISPSSVSVVWNSITNATTYDFEYRASSASNWQRVTLNKDRISSQLNGLVQGTEYMVRVRANNNVGSGVWSSPITITTLSGTPVTQGFSKVTGLRATSITATNVTLNWDSQSGASYRIAYRQQGTNVWNQNNYSSSNSKTVESLSPNTVYEFSVGPVAAEGLEVTSSDLYSEFLLATTPNAVPGTTTSQTSLAQVTGLRSTTITNSSVALIWNPIANAQYQVYYTVTNGQPITVNVPYNFTTITGLNPSTSYFFSVRAVSGTQQGLWSQTIPATTASQSAEPGFSVTGGTGVTTGTGTGTTTGSGLYSQSGQLLRDGDIVQATGSYDVYILKIVGGQRYKRLILNPQIFNSYGHLRWENIQEVSQATLNAYTTSNLVREVNGDGRVYRLFPSGDTGVKSYVQLTTQQFLSAGGSDVAIYGVNSLELNLYTTISPITTVEQFRSGRRP